MRDVSVFSDPQFIMPVNGNMLRLTSGRGDSNEFREVWDAGGFLEEDMIDHPINVDRKFGEMGNKGVYQLCGKGLAKQVVRWVQVLTGTQVHRTTLYQFPI
jgi:hypothetical protein